MTDYSYEARKRAADRAVVITRIVFVFTVVNAVFALANALWVTFR